MQLRRAVPCLLLCLGLAGCPVYDGYCTQDLHPPRDSDFVAFPADGATDVPLNTRIWQVGGYPTDWGLFGPGGEVALAESGYLGSEVTGLVDLRAPAESLEPGATYEIRSEVRTISTFATGEEPLSTPPPPPEILGVETETILDPWTRSCDFEMGHLIVTVARSSAFAVLTPRTAEDPFDGTFYGGQGIDFTPEDTLESYDSSPSAYVVSVDLAGNLSDWVDLGELDYPPRDAAGGCSMSGPAGSPSLGASCLLLLAWVARRRRRAPRPWERGSG